MDFAPSAAQAASSTHHPSAFITTPALACPPYKPVAAPYRSGVRSEAGAAARRRSQQHHHLALIHGVGVPEQYITGNARGSPHQKVFTTSLDQTTPGHIVMRWTHLHALRHRRFRRVFWQDRASVHRRG